MLDLTESGSDRQKSIFRGEKSEENAVDTNTRGSGISVPAPGTKAKNTRTSGISVHGVSRQLFSEKSNFSPGEVRICKV